MKPKTHPSITALFCEDIRREIAETATLVGIFPDNLALTQIPGTMPKLGLYVRGRFLTRKAPKTFVVKLNLPWESLATELSAIDPTAIAAEARAAREKGVDTFGLIAIIVFSPFQVRQAGRAEVIVSLGTEEWNVGSINFVPATPQVRSAESDARPRKLRTSLAKVRKKKNRVR